MTPAIKPPKVTGEKPPKPCPTCYSPMKVTKGKDAHYYCEKHGIPT